MIGLRGPDEFKASEESRVKENQIRPEIPLEIVINQEYLWQGNKLKRPSGLSNPNIYFEMSPLRVRFKEDNTPL